MSPFEHMVHNHPPRCCIQPHALRNEADISGAVIKCSCRARRCKNRDTRPAANEERPLVGIGAPVPLAHATCVCDANFATGAWYRFLREHLVGESELGARGGGSLGVRLEGSRFGREGARKYIFLLLRDVLEDLRREMETFREHGSRSVRYKKTSGEPLRCWKAEQLAQPICQ